MRRLVLFLALQASTLSACASGSKGWEPPANSPPAPTYEEVDATPEELWNATVDFLVDTGTEWNYISQEMRLARFNVLLTSGPAGYDGYRVIRETQALQYANCGLQGGETAAGYGDLYGAVAIRIRKSPDGTGLLKVVVPRMWEENRLIGREAISCVSTGRYEEIVRSEIQSRLEMFRR